jgi:putative membrane protein
MFEIVRLLWGTIWLRPYVFAFLLVYLVAATAHLGLRRTLCYVPLGYLIAWCSEYASIHWGFPYGDYFYLHDTVGRELWVGGVPFMDSLSYVFLSYCSYSLAIFLLSPVLFAGSDTVVLETRSIRRSWRTLVLGAFLFVFLDIIIDPVALQGHRWFLGQIYGYRTPGLYFGIPMSNFAGWLLVGLAMIACLQALERVSALDLRGGSALRQLPCIALLGPALYVSVLIFNLAVTIWIGERLLALVGCLLVLFPGLCCFFFTLYKHDHLTPDQIERHRRDFPGSRLSRLPHLYFQKTELRRKS